MNPPTRTTLVSKIGLGIGVIVVAAVFVSLGFWQLDRAAALKASLVTATKIDEKVVELTSIATANTSLAPTALNRMVKVSGHYVADFKAPRQVDSNGKIEDWHISLLQIGTSEGVLIARGLWSERLLNPDIQQSMVIDVVGLLHARQDGDRAENSANVISRLDSAVIIGLTDLELFDGYVIAKSENHNGDELIRSRLTAEKLASRIPGFYWQHLSYVVIWWLMAAVVLYLPWYRRKVRL